MGGCFLFTCKFVPRTISYDNYDHKKYCFFVSPLEYVSGIIKVTVNILDVVESDKKLTGQESLTSGRPYP